MSDHLRCAVNASTGFESEVVIAPADTPRNILVVGGGPAGMEVARVAALRGHRVTLIESGGALGGTAYFSSIVYKENGKLIDYLAGQMRLLAVNTVLNTDVDDSVIRAHSPDAVVIATGAKRDALPIVGADLEHVFSGDALRSLMTGIDVTSVAGKLGLLARMMMRIAGLLGVTRNAALLRRLSYYWMPVGKRVVIVGGGLVGVELAEFLAQRGRTVTVVESGEKFGVELAIVRRWRVLDDLRRLGVVLINKTEVTRIERSRLWLAIDGTEVDIPAETVILAAGATGDRSLVDVSRALGYETHSAGDCDGLSYIEGAIRSGNAVGRAL